MNHPLRRILLLWPGSLWAGTHVRRNLPVKFPLLSLFSHLTAHGVPVEILDLHAELGLPEPEEHAVEDYVRQGMRLLQAREFDVLAVSCWSSFDFLGAWAFAERFRAVDGSAPIVVGGYHVSSTPEDFTVPGSPFDYVVCGEGERALLELARSRATRRQPHPLVIQSAQVPMDTVWQDLAGYPYLTGRPAKLDVFLSRGCPHHCAFCAGASQGRLWRPYSPADALQAVRDALAVRPHALDLLDACFGCSTPWRREVLAGLIDMDIDLPLSVQTRPEMLGPEDFRLLSQLDIEVQLGVETFSPTMAEIMNKSRNGDRHVEQARAAIMHAERSGVSTSINLVINHPGETPQTIEQTVAEAERLVGGSDVVRFGLAVSICTAFPGSDVLTRRSHYESEYGSVFRHPTWWREARPQNALSYDLRASHALADYRPWHQRLLDLRREAVIKWPADRQLQALRRRRALSR